MSGRRWSAQIVVIAVVLGGLSSALPARSAGLPPSLRLLRSTREITVERWPGEKALFDLGTYVASVGGGFEVHARRTELGVRGRQVRRGADGSIATVRRLRPSMLAFTKGLRGFFDLTIRDASGAVVRRASRPFCPGGQTRARLSASGPDRGRYPQTNCHASEVTRAVVWGLDRGWAVAAPEYAARVPDGTYTIQLAIAPQYVDLFDIPASDARTSVRVTVRTLDDSCADCERAPDDTHGHHHAAQVPEVAAAATGLPDLVALPAHNIGTTVPEGTRRDHLVFGATVWNAGPGPLVVEGFRRPGRDVMDAKQFLYDRGRKVGTHAAGTMEYDHRDGHHHWHFQDFATYRLVDRSRQKVVRSGKEAFCLANTDPVDLTVRNANWAPESTDLHSSCGGISAIWVREVLDVGWGDTYFQTLPGQSLDVTGVPNGVYLIEVITNRKGRLREADTSNNRALTKIRLGGERGVRTVKVLS